MTIDLEEHIRRYAETVDKEIAADRVARSNRSVQSTKPDRHFAGPLLAVAAVAVLVVGLGAAVNVRDTPPAASEPVETPSSLPPVAAPVDPTGRGVVIDMAASIDNETSVPVWESIRVAPGTIGWFDTTTGIPDEIRESRTLTTGLSAEGLSVFFSCANWTVDDDGPICSELSGGNGIDHVEYGAETASPYLGIGVQLGDTDVRSQLWNQAYGSLWGYETIDAVPEPTEIPIGDTVGLSYRVDAVAYLAWEYAPDVVVWLHSNGLSDRQLAEIAVGVEPVELPDRLPLLLEIAPTDFASVAPVAGDPVQDAPFLVGSNGPPVLKYGTVDGQSCVAFEFFRECRSTQAAALLPSIEWGDRLPDRLAAIAPLGSGLTLRAFAVDGTITDTALESTGLDVEVAAWTATSIEQHLLSASLVDADGNTVADTGPLSENER